MANTRLTKDLFYDISNAGNLESPHWYQAQMIDRLNQKRTIFDIASEHGVDLLEYDLFDTKGVDFNQPVRGITEYTYVEMAELSTTEDDYKNLEGIGLNTTSTRYIQFIATGEKEYQGLEWDTVLDAANLPMLKMKTLNGWAKGLAKRRESVYLEQTLNSGLLIQDAGTDLAPLFQFVNSDADPSTWDLANLTADNIYDLCGATVDYFSKLKQTDKTPVYFVSTKIYNTVVKSQLINQTYQTSNSPDGAVMRGEATMFNNCLLIKNNDFGSAGAYKDIDMLMVMTGNARLIEIPFLQPVTFTKVEYNTDINTGQSRITPNRDSMVATFQQMVILGDNFFNSETNEYELTNRFWIFNSNKNFVQDLNKVLTGIIKGAQVPKVISTIPNRTMSSWLEGLIDNTKDGSVAYNPKPIDHPTPIETYPNDQSTLKPKAPTPTKAPKTTK